MATLVRSPKVYPFVAWERLKPFINWKQGQHVFTSGGTGSGKSTLMGELLPRRKLVVVAVSKGMDEIFEGPYFKDYITIYKWPPPPRMPGEPKDKWTRVLLRPKPQKTLKATKVHKTEVFQEMFDDILLKRGQWCIALDEEHYASETLKLKGEITDILEQGRSAGISMWNNTQRPAGIPLATYVNSSHAFLFQAEEEYDVGRLARMAGKHSNREELAFNLGRLESFETHEFIYLDRTQKIPPVRSIVGSKAYGARKR